MKSSLALAIEALSWVELRKVNYLSALKRATRQLQIEDEETIATARRLVRNTLQRKNWIDNILDLTLTPSSLDDFNLGIQSFLRIFVFKTKFNYNGIEEAIILAKTGRSVLGWKSLRPIEEVLGTILSMDLGEMLSGFDEFERMSLQTFHPQWFIRYCLPLMGRREGVRLLNYSTPPLRYITINTVRGHEEEVRQGISDPDIVLDIVKEMPFLYRVAQGVILPTSEAYRRGLVSFQDKASCLAALMGGPRANHTVLAVGARSVATTLYLAQLMENRGEIVAMMSSARQRERLEHEIGRLGINIVKPLTMKDPQPLNAVDGVDLVLLSPECSDTGVFWRRPSLKWKVSFKTVEDAVRIQWGILTHYADYVKEGGCLIYWTRSITVEENEMLVERFLKLRPEFNLVAGNPRIGVAALRGQQECQRLYPHLHEADGSYFATLIKEW